jgi:hypothetical protein
MSKYSCNTFMKNVQRHHLETRNVTSYFRHVDYFLLYVLYCCKKIRSYLLTASTDQIHKDILFKPTHEDNRQINFLHLFLIVQQSKIKLTYFEGPPTQTQLSVSSQTALQNIKYPQSDITSQNYTH